MSGAKKIMMGGGGAVAEPFEIEQSLIFNKASTAKLERTPSSGGNRRTFTISTWFKIGEAAVTDYTYYLYGAHINGQNNDNSWFSLFIYNGRIGVGAWNQNWIRTNRVLRDHAAWYHIVVAIDTTLSTAANRVRLYVNGVEQTSDFEQENNPSQNLELAVNRVSYPQTVGSVTYSNTKYWDGYMAEYHLIDGTALAPSSFGETNSDTGQWIPKEYTGGSYGTNGFYQKYEKGAAADTPFLFEGDFTIEMFFKLTSMQVAGGYSYPVLLWLPPHNGVPAGGNQGYKLQVNNAAAGYQLYMYAEEPNTFDASWGGSGANSIALNTWYHIALVREGMGSNNLSTYMNGTRRWQGTYTDPVGSIGSTAYIGASGRNYGNWAGYINNLRIVKGTAVYSGSSYTTPTSNLTAISGTSLLALQGSGITDRLPASAPTLTAYDTGGGGHTPIIQSNISGAVGTYTGLFYKDGYNNGNGGGISFNVPSAMGKDSSGNNNDFTPASLLSTDVVIDSPTSNFATLNPLDSALPALLEGNTNTGTAGANSWKMARSTFELTTGKWYWEMKWTGNTVNSTNGYQMGLKTPTSTLTAAAEQAGSFAFQGTYTYLTAGSVNTVTISPGSATTGQNDIIMFAYDADAGKMWIGVNGTWTSSGNPATGSNFQWTSIPTTGVSPFAGIYGSNISIDSNFGQKTFAYTPPSGFKSLSTKNLPDPAIPLPSAQFNTVLYNGTGSTPQTVTGVGFQPDFVWIKNRPTGGTNYVMYDAVRGTNKTIASSTTNAESSDDAAGFSAFTSDGFTLRSLTTAQGTQNTLNQSQVSWNWKANGSGSTDTSGDIDAVVSANQAAGFSVVTWTATGSNTATIPHGLGVAPEIIFYKARSTSGNWNTWTTAIDGSNDSLLLNTTAAKSDNSGSYGNLTSSFFPNWGLGNGITMVAYCFASKPGFSKIGVYTGNGNASGPFISTGFKPAWLMIKRTTGVGDWALRDNKRDPYNVSNTALYANYNIAEGSTSLIFDILSNGFKLRSNHVEVNGNNETYLFMAFAESAFKSSTAR